MTLGLAATLLAGGCVLLQEMGLWTPPLAFSHRLHAEEGEDDCLACHPVAVATTRPALPPLDDCTMCHEGVDEEKPPERSASALYADGVLLASRVSRLDDEVRFAHDVHLEPVEDCESCHAGVASSDRIDQDVRVTMDECIDCHREKGLPVDCASCHDEIDRNWQPPSHESLWMQRHGHVARMPGDGVSDRCSLCHEESTCDGCHREVPPADHNNLWRLRSHAFAATMDRDTCATCHRRDFCDRCHRETAPLSHAGSFGPSPSLHCLSCHFPLQGEGCFTCHKGMPSHGLATPMPADHLPGMNCRQCHGLEAPMPHVDKGDDCIGCHF